jgi:para-nitrobenzyl esterase
MLRPNGLADPCVGSLAPPWALYPNASPSDRLISTLTDSNFCIRSLALAEHKVAQGGGPVWLYSFDWETPVFGGKIKAYHALDVPFVFNINRHRRCDRSPTVSRRMSTTWTTVARTGRPDNAAKAFAQAVQLITSASVH